MLFYLLKTTFTSNIELHYFMYKRFVYYCGVNLEICTKYFLLTTLVFISQIVKRHILKLSLLVQTKEGKIFGYNCFENVIYIILMCHVNSLIKLFLYLKISVDDPAFVTATETTLPNDSYLTTNRNNDKTSYGTPTATSFMPR